MFAIRALAGHLSVGLIALTMSAAAFAQTPAAGSPGGTANFVVLYRGARVGAETVSVSSTGTGWLIASAGRLLAPVDLITTRFEIRYASDWQPQQLALEGLVAGQPMTLATSFGLTTATNDLFQSGRRDSTTQQVSPRPVVLPNNVFSAYEALAGRLASAVVGTRLPIYVAPEAEVAATVDRITSRRIALPDTVVEVREFALTVNSAGGMIPIEIWIDTHNRLVRLVMPASALVVIREDVASVMAREERGRNPGDEDLFIGAVGFTLGATVTKPATAPVKAPAVILVSAPGPQDRDFTLYGVSIFTELAGALARAGNVVVRYDGRGIGRSGGRTENASLAEYAGDVRQIVTWLRKRKDVDGNRIAVIGYGDAGPIAMVAASREKNIRAVALIAAPGRTGRETTLEQQERVLASLRIPESERAAKIALQRRLVDATMSGSGWDGIPVELRRQTETPWFKSWLEFDPEATMARLSQPVFVGHGALDMETPVAHGERLADFSLARRKLAASRTRKVIVPGMNHLLVAAKTGETREYETLENRSVSAELADALTVWLADVRKPGF